MRRRGTLNGAFVPDANAVATELSRCVEVTPDPRR
jgi:hypothetical protein